MTVTVPQDSNKCKIQSNEGAPLNKRQRKSGKTRGDQKEGRHAISEGRLCLFVECWKRITNDPYVLSIVAKGCRLRFTSPPLLLQTPWEIRFPK